MWLKEEISCSYRARDNIKLHLKLVQDELRPILHNVEFDCLESKIAEEVSKLSEVKYEKLKKKISILVNKQETTQKKQETHFSDYKFYPRFVNLTNMEFNQKEIRILEKGPKFTPPNNNDQKEIIGVQTELIIANNSNIINNPTRHRHKSADIINKDIPFPSYSDVRETVESIRRKRKSNKLIFTKADKGNSIVCLEELEYQTKMLNTVNTLDVTLLKKDPTTTFNNDVKRALDDSLMLFPTSWDIKKSTCMNPQPPEMYGFIKLHKEGNPTRPVVSYIDTPTDPIYRTRYFQESQEGLYGGTLFLLTYDLVSIPFSFISTAAASAIIYPLIGSFNPLSEYVYFSLVLWACYVFSEQQTIAIMMIVKNDLTAAITNIYITGICVTLGSGILRSIKGLQEWLFYSTYATQIRYASAFLNRKVFTDPLLNQPLPFDEQHNCTSMNLIDTSLLSGVNNPYCRYASGQAFLTERYSRDATDIIFSGILEKDFNIGVTFAFTLGIIFFNMFLYLIPLPDFIKAKFRK